MKAMIQMIIMIIMMLIDESGVDRMILLGWGVGVIFGDEDCLKVCSKAHVLCSNSTNY
jgi:hypothetical protein